MVQITLTIDLPRATIDAIRKPTNINSSIRAMTDAISHSTPTLAAAINNLPEVAFPTTSIKREREYPDGFDITVKSYTGWEFPVEVHNELSIRDLKFKVAAIQGISAAVDMELVIDGNRRLWGTCAISEVKEGDVVVLHVERM